MRCVLLRAVFLAVVASSVCLMSSGIAFANPGDGGNCGGCHTATPGKQDLTQTSTVTAHPGDPVSFTIKVINGIGDAGQGNQFAVAITGKGTTGSTLQSLSNLSGDTNSANKLIVPADATWTQQTVSSKVYYTDGPNTWTGSPVTKTYSFTIPSTTPYDTYHMVMKVAGGSGGDWSEVRDVYLQVTAPVPEPATLVMLCGGALVGLVCWRGRKGLTAK
jgi:hypothetical protein